MATTAGKFTLNASGDLRKVRLGVEFGAAEQPQLAQHGRTHLLGLIDEQHGPTARALQVGQPGFTQDLEASPAIVGSQADTPKTSPISR